MTINNHMLVQWNNFLAEHQDVEFVWLQTMTYRAVTLLRIVPIAKFSEMLKTGKWVALPKLILFICPGDSVADGGLHALSDSMLLQPSISTAYCRPDSRGTRAVVQCDWVEKDSGIPVKECARSCLQYLDNTLQRTMGVFMLVGFEIEVVFMRPKQQEENGVSKTTYEPITQDQAFSEISKGVLEQMDFIETIIRRSTAAGVCLEHIHPEAAPGQWEFVLPPEKPVAAIDRLLKARDIIRQVAGEAGIIATLHPRLSSHHPGTGAHVHLSVNELRPGVTSRPIKAAAECFFAGIISHLPSILAFTLAQPVSYERVATGLWSGGEHACWGWETKEVPLRRIEDTRFEMKLMDGFANPYLALSALLSAGLDGMTKETPLTAGPCKTFPADLSEAEQQALGITTRLPKTLDDALAKLAADRDLIKIMGEKVVSSYLMVKKGEAKVLENMDPEERLRWLIARY